MKNILLILLLILAFGGCKDDEQVEPEAAVVYEEWKPLELADKSVSDKIVSIELVQNRVHIQTKDNYFGLDTNLSLVESARLLTTSPPFDLWGPKYNEEYALFRNEFGGLSIIDLSQPTNDQISFKVNKGFFGQTVGHWNSSPLNDDNKFSTVSIIREGENILTVMQNFAISHVSSSPTPISLVEESRIILDSLKSESWPPLDIKVYKNSANTICILNRDYYVFNESELLAKHNYSFTNIFEHKGNLYAGGDTMEILQDGRGSWITGLFISRDFGESWDLLFEKYELKTSQLQLLENLLFITGVEGLHFCIFDIETGEIKKKMDYSGLQGLNCIEKVGDNVLVGTDHGLYYKSWKSFLNK
ncbi:MAG TPA: hypothetical protein DCX01_04580 [Bacteroidetes bacterium]|jgi:hypothetical protein|nr:hypothetical protein [Bacteroidota bacterium]